MHCGMYSLIYFSLTSVLVDETFLVLRVRLSHLSGLLDLAKDVGKYHGGVLGGLADVAHLLAAEGVVITRLSIAQRVGDPFLGVGQNRPDVAVGRRVALDVVKQARRFRCRCQYRCRYRCRFGNECVNNDGGGTEQY